MRTLKIKCAVTLWLGLATGLAAVQAQNADLPGPAPAPAGTSAPGGVVELVSLRYVLRQGDAVQVKVYQEEDLSCISKVDKDGAITIPLLGSVQVANKTLAEATTIVKNLLARNYLVNPQVSLNVTEFSKRRFTVLGQVQRPGTYDMPADDSISLLQAIATAGGYTRIANPRRITVQRSVGSENKVFKLNAEELASDRSGKPFAILPDDVVIVGERWM